MSKGSITGGGENGLYSVTIERDQGAPVTAPAWCADLTEDLSGDVGVIEIAGDRDKGINIQPGHDGNAAYDADRDGDLYLVPSYPPKEGQQAGVYWNWAMRPGWQKWRPNYRYGTITEIDHDADTCSVTLDECLSTDTPDGAAMDINQTSSLSAVPIEYMSCNSAAFSVDDEVVVKFENFDWGSPKVIGFKEEPKACFWEDWEDGICGKHNWQTRDYVTMGWVSCALASRFTLEDEVIHYDMPSNYGIFNTLWWQANGVDDPVINNKNKCIMEIAVSGATSISPLAQVEIRFTSGTDYIEEIINEPYSGALEIDISSLGDIDGVQIWGRYGRIGLSYSIDTIQFHN